MVFIYCIFIIWYILFFVLFNNNDNYNNNITSACIIYNEENHNVYFLFLRELLFLLVLFLLFFFLFVLESRRLRLFRTKVLLVNARKRFIIMIARIAPRNLCLALIRTKFFTVLLSTFPELPLFFAIHGCANT